MMYEYWVSGGWRVIANELGDAYVIGAIEHHTYAIFKKRANTMRKDDMRRIEQRNIVDSMISACEGDEEKEQFVLTLIVEYLVPHWNSLGFECMNRKNTCNPTYYDVQCISVDDARELYRA